MSGGNIKLTIDCLFERCTRTEIDKRKCGHSKNLHERASAVWESIARNIYIYKDMSRKMGKMGGQGRRKALAV